MRSTVKQFEPLAPYTSWRIGGPADRYYRPQDSADLVAFLKTLEPDVPITWLGLGSNVLIHDDGIRGVVIHLLFSAEPSLVHLSDTQRKQCPKHLENQPVVCVEAGVPCAKLAKFCVKQGLRGAEFFSGIPGTIGGALKMNAGAWGSETWEHVVMVETIDRAGVVRERFVNDYQIGYRSAMALKGEQEWFLKGYFSFEPGEAALSSTKIKALLKERSDKQPIGTFSCGSVFRNPEGHFAGQLIEASKLKGFKIGDAMVSDKHANFIINLGKATARDVRALIDHIQQVVQQDHQVLLETEVKMLGF